MSSHSNNKHPHSKILIALLIMLVVFIGLNSHLFISLGIFNFTSNKPETIDLDIEFLEKIGFDTKGFERDVNRLIANMNNAQQGNHFIFGIIAGLIFSQPTAGLTVGLIKESLDFVNNYRGGNINSGYFIDAFVDTIFWFLGGFVGFYLLGAIYDLFRHYNIRGPKDLIIFLGKKILKKQNSPPL